MIGIKRLLSGMSKRALALTLTLVMSLAAATGGTLAWLVDQTEAVKNVFTYGDVHIDMQEDDDDNDGDTRANTYKMMPGKAISKRPYVTVFQDTEDCYVFVQVEESENFGDYLTYAAAEGWTALEGVTGVYYREVNATDVADANVDYEFLADNKVMVRPEITAEDLRKLDEGGTANYPTMTFTAYAVQRDASIDGIDSPAEAWAATQDQNPIAASDTEPTVDEAPSDATVETPSELPNT